MNNKINEFKKMKDEIFLDFGVDKEYFLNILDDYSWEIITDENIKIVKYRKGNIEKSNLIVHKGEEALIFEKNGYTLVIAIDCIKMAFVFKNDLKR